MAELNGDAALATSQIAARCGVGYSLRSENIGISSKLAAEFKQARGRGYFKNNLQQTAALECLECGHKVQTTGTNVHRMPAGCAFCRRADCST